LVACCLFYEVVLASSLDVVISEIAWMGTEVSSYDEWIELKNNTDVDVNLTGWTLNSEDGSPAISLSGVIPANGYFLLERTDDEPTSLIANQIYTGTLENGGEKLVLVNSGGEIIDSISSSWAAGDKDAKRTMVRTDFLASGTGSGAWETYSGSGSSVTDVDGNFILGTPQNSSATVQDLRVLISEVSPKNLEADFIELYVQSGDDLDGVVVKRKNSPREIFVFDSAFPVSAGDLVVIELREDKTFVYLAGESSGIVEPAQKGLSSGSEALEVVLSDGVTADFMCWKKGDLSVSVQDEVDDNIPQNWSEDCVDISNIISNESIARSNLVSDSDTKSDFFRHFNGSMGDVNLPQNSDPEAVITIQGAKRIYQTSLNFTGEDSTDPDGDHDLESFLWLVNEESCPSEGAGWRWKNDCNDSIKSNPYLIYFDDVGVYEICLEVKDYSGGLNKKCDQIEVVEGENGNIIDPFGLAGGGASIFSSKVIQAWIEVKFAKNVSTSHKGLIKRGGEKTSADFFKGFYLGVDPEFLRGFLRKTKKNGYSERPIFEKRKLPLFKKDEFSKKDKRRMRKNLGMMFE